MKSAEKVALLLGRIEYMQDKAIRLQGELSQLVHDLSLLKSAIGGPESPFGVIYPIPPIRE